MWQNLVQVLTSAVHEHPDLVLANSLGAEDMVITHAIYEAGLPISVFILDTGRLHTETVSLIDQVEQRYGIQIERFYPDEEAVAEYVGQHGAFAFYESLELRKRCCEIRKVLPLRRALAGRSAWITGQRREQAATRSGLSLREDDTVFGLVKFNPLVEWTEADVWREIRARDVLYNPLHDAGYPSIGCDPCTRPIRPGEDPRAGRWWWEQADQKECGLHAGNLGRVHPIAVARS